MLHNDFKMTIVPLLYSNDKELKEIQQIVKSIKVANLAKYTIKATTNLVIIAKKKHLDKQNTSKSKTNEKCFNCKKKELLCKKLLFLKQKKAQKVSRKSQMYLIKEKSSQQSCCRQVDNRL